MWWLARRGLNKCSVFKVYCRSMSSTGFLVDDPKYSFLKELDISSRNLGVYDGKWGGTGNVLTTYCPANNRPIAEVVTATLPEYNKAVEASVEAWKVWADIPAPQRGEIVRQIGDALRQKKSQLGRLVSLEMGKIVAEGEGEVQEYIDICDYAVGLSRTMEGKWIPSERPGHALLEAWNPLGVVGVISAFNFPVAVYGWNNAIALVCGDTVVWKGASTTPLCGVAVTKILAKVFEANNLPGATCALVTGGPSVGDAMSKDDRVRLLSFTGSTPVGRQVALKVQERFGRSLLELGGNNAILVDRDADIEMVVRASLFACVGTAGQRCTTTRRLIVHHEVSYALIHYKEGSVFSVYTNKPQKVIPEKFSSISSRSRRVSPVECASLQAPVHCGEAHSTGLTCRDRANLASRQCSLVLWVESTPPELNGSRAREKLEQLESGAGAPSFVRDSSFYTTWLPSFALALIVVCYFYVDDSIDCCDNGCSFQHTGGGRESGSDSWKQYMRRSTCTINYTRELPLAQGIKFE
ncbi:unnamed protein product [Ixodes hexagonus]